MSDNGAAAEDFYFNKTYGDYIKENSPTIMMTWDRLSHLYQLVKTGQK